MSNTKTIAIDLRWLDSSGVGVYIKGIMPGIVEAFSDARIVGIGRRSRLEEFAWGRASNVQLVDCQADRYSLAEQFQLPRAIPPETDLFFSPYYTIPLLYRGRLAVTVHDMSHLVVAEIVGNWKKRLYAQTMYRFIRRRASVVLTVSDFSRSEFLRLTSGPREPVVVTTHLGMSAEWFTAAQLPPVRSKAYFVCVGNVKPYKNLNRLVDAFLMVRDRIPQDLVIVGQSEGLITSESPGFFAKVQAAGNRIHLSGLVSQQELLSLVGHSHALVMPSLYEGFGLPPVEAMAAGVPVAVAHAASMPEICGDAALYFDPLRTEDIANALLTLASGDFQRERFIAKGRARSREFSWDACSRQTVEALRAALD